MEASSNQFASSASAVQGYTPKYERRLIITTMDDGSEFIEELSNDGLIFKNTGEMLHALVSGRLGEKVTQTLASHACMSMAVEAGKMLRQARRTEVSNALSCIKGMTHDELHALSSEAYKELCMRSSRA